ncbi:hypothetical protein ACQPZQ_09100 [Pseudonocardia sp. CA-142604]|uniref:hypothetical protein n=1 Tax=Pseudonocardia sp. CA-142604 TaxID=3240024 RepID=UPI003D8A8204
MGLPGGAAKAGKPDLLAVASSLRWVRPDLTAALADHVLEWASLVGERDLWLTAAGWALNARLATGDGRTMASDIVEELPRWGAAPLAGPSAHRLRVELALAAGRVGERDLARSLVAPVTADATAPEAQADAFCVLARCAVDDAPDLVADALRRAEQAWSQVEAPYGEIGAASVALIRAAAQRAADRPDTAVEHAAEGLARLERSRGSDTPGTPSAHLAAALAAEWISALLDAGRVDEAREGCLPLMPRLSEPARPSRHLARLRLTVARTVTTGGVEPGTVEALEQAARDAADSDVPDLEAVCRSALAAVQAKAGRSVAAQEAMRLGDAAEIRDSDRTGRLRATLAALPAATLSADEPAKAEEGGRSAGRNGAVHPTDPLNDDLHGEWTAGWNDASAECPIGDLLFRSLRSGPNGTGHAEEDVAESDPLGAVWSDSSRPGDSWLEGDWAGESAPPTSNGRRGSRLDGRPEDREPTRADSPSSGSGADLIAGSRRGSRDRTQAEQRNDARRTGADSSSGPGRDLFAFGRREGLGRSERDPRQDDKPTGAGDDLFEPGSRVRGRSSVDPQDDLATGADHVIDRARRRRNGSGSPRTENGLRDEDPLTGLDWLNGGSNGAGRNWSRFDRRTGADRVNGRSGRGRSDGPDDGMLTSAEWLAGASRKEFGTSPAGRGPSDAEDDRPFSADRSAEGLDGGARGGAGLRDRGRPEHNSLTAEDWLTGRSSSGVRRNGRGSARSGRDRQDEQPPTGASNGRSLRNGLANVRRIGRDNRDRQHDDSLTGVDWLAAGPRRDELGSGSHSGGDRHHDAPLTGADWLAGDLHGDVLGTSGRRGGRSDDDLLRGERGGADSRSAGTHSSDERERPTNGTSGSWSRRRDGGGRGADRASRGLGRSRDDQGGDASGGRGRRDEPGPGRADAPRNGRRKHRLDDPWATGQWSIVPSADEQGGGVRKGRRNGSSDAGSAAMEPTPERESAVSAVANPEAWLNAALADLERIRKRSNPADAAPAPAAPDVEGSVVAIDVVRDGRRFAGKRAAAVVRSLADRLIDRLPPGARLRFDEADALSVVLSGWEHGDAVAWMHRTLPGLLSGVTSGEDMPGAHLRAAVHDADGPVGAQIMQRLDSVTSRSATPERKHVGQAGNGRSAHGTWGDLGAAARSAARDTGTVNGSSRRRSRESSPGRTRDSDRGEPSDLPRNGATAAHSLQDSRREDSSEGPGKGAPSARSTRNAGREYPSDAPGNGASAFRSPGDAGGEGSGDGLGKGASAVGSPGDIGGNRFGDALGDGASAFRSTRGASGEGSGDARGKGAPSARSTRNAGREYPSDAPGNGASAFRSPGDAGGEGSGDGLGKGAPSARSTRNAGRETSSDAPGDTHDAGPDDVRDGPENGGWAVRSTHAVHDADHEESGDAPAEGTSRSGSQHGGALRGSSNRTAGRDGSSVDAASDESFSPGGSDVRDSSAAGSQGTRASGSAAGVSEPSGARSQRAGRESGSSTKSGLDAAEASGGGSRGKRVSGTGAKNGAGRRSGAGALNGSARDADPAASSRARGSGEGSRSADTSSGDTGKPSPSGGVTERDSGGESGAGGRHEADGRTPFRAAGEAGSEGNRHRRDGTENPSRPAQEEIQSTEGLGIADLLAGALAAYRGI